MFGRVLIFFLLFSLPGLGLAAPPGVITPPASAVSESVTYGNVAAGGFDATITLINLNPATLGGFTIPGPTVTLSYSDSTGQQYSFSLVGPELVVPGMSGGVDHVTQLFRLPAGWVMTPPPPTPGILVAAGVLTGGEELLRVTVDHLDPGQAQTVTLHIARRPVPISPPGPIPAAP